MEINNAVTWVVEVQSAFLDAADELDQLQYSASPDPLVEEFFYSPLEVLAQQPLQSVRNVGPIRSHQAKRLYKNRKKNQHQALPKKENLRQDRLTKAVGNATTVPVEFSDLRPSLKPQREPRVYQYEELVQMGIRTIQWDGVYALISLSSAIQLIWLHRDTIPIKTPSGIIIAVLAGCPHGPGWDEHMKHLTEDVDAAASLMTFPKVVKTDKGTRHRRGDYPATNTGVSYGGGSQVCILLVRFNTTWADFLLAPW